MLRSIAYVILIGLTHSKPQTDPDGFRITLSNKSTHVIPKLYGMMYEDINVSTSFDQVIKSFRFRVFGFIELVTYTFDQLILDLRD